MSKKDYKLPEGVRYLTAAELDARRTDRTLAKAEQKVTSDGWDLGAALRRRARKSRAKKHRIPKGIWGLPR